MIQDSLSVSIVTPTQFERIKYLEILIQCILQQDYVNILEWIIVDGTQNNKHELRGHIDTLRKKYKNLPEIVFIEPDNNSSKNVGVLRNLYNEKCRGDIIVCMDDDDYYPYNRVSHAVSRLKNSILEVGGCSGINIYSVQFQRAYLWKRFHLNQGGNASLSYTNNYAKTHFYEDVSCGEEKFFIKNYMGFKCEPGKEREQTMVQFDTDKSLMSIAHASTFNKSKLFSDNELRPQQTKFIFHSQFTLKQYVKNAVIMDMYKKLFSITNDNNDDVDDITFLYMRQDTIIDLNKCYHQSECNQMCLLANFYAKQKKKVSVYTNLKDNTTRIDNINIQDDTIKLVNNVKYRNYFTIDSRIKYKKLIVIGLESLILVDELNIKYDRLVYVHDSVKPLEDKYLINVKIDRYISRTNYGIKEIINKKKAVHIPRGIDIHNIQSIIDTCKTENINRNFYRLCYVNSYETGLLPIIQYLYPELKKLQPNIELHLYGSIRENTNKQLVDMIEKYIKQDGIIDHGICDMDTIIKEKLQSGFHLNFIDYPKVDSVSIKESIYCKCIPIISNKDCFKELSGIHFNVSTEKVLSYIQIANALNRILNDMKINNGTILSLQNQICNQQNIQALPDIHTVFNTWNDILYEDGFNI